MPGIISDGEGRVSMESLARFPECIACNQGIDTNDPAASYTIVKHEHVHLSCPAVTELSAAYAREVKERLTVGADATRSHSQFRDSLLDEEETEELVEAYLLGTPAIEFAKLLENRDIAVFEAASDPCPDRVFPTAENE